MTTYFYTNPLQLLTKVFNVKKGAVVLVNPMTFTRSSSRVNDKDNLIVTAIKSAFRCDRNFKKIRADAVCNYFKSFNLCFVTLEIIAKQSFQYKGADEKLLEMKNGIKRYMNFKMLLLYSL